MNLKMKKSKHLLYLLFLIPIIFLQMSNISFVRAADQLTYNDVSVNVYYNNAEYKFYLYIEIGSIYDSVTEENLTGVSPTLVNSKYYIYNSSDSMVLSGTFTSADNTGIKYNKSISLENVPNGVYYVGFHFTNPIGGDNNTGSALKSITTFNVNHTIVLNYNTIYDEGDDEIAIICDIVPTYSGWSNFISSDFGVKKYYIEKDNRIVLQGNLTLENNQLVARGLKVTGKGSGTYKVWLKVEFSNIGLTVDTEDGKDTHFFVRNKPVEDLLNILVYIIAGVVSIIVVVYLITRKGSGSVEKKKKKEEKKPLETIDISKPTNIKPKKEHKKEKGKTKVSQDLIFSVPQWEVDDDEEEDAS